ncbi:RHS repeat-associated core domain-containing protein [Leptospira langatensis]|uniref:RHS repeat-associated core domain-containing protein n=1 Tax=Leptospira langatensis TaxID=2484983 RepID=A0A5F1ZT31_9LEPT|nr:RHS repeat-associated core domain-containing protein [Leptospira langatensis]TGK02797.1 RHS repeat-associated core domain-containing protein [Leptospira langatensis]TGL39998.1 RHS repeat-associated core domain-containing protein [Leptospira langatensis]
MSDSEPVVARPAVAGSPKSNSGIDGSGVPAVGGFFYQTDRLGSTSMLTDGNGNPVSGPGRSGVSYVGYLPYGEMNTTESGGPDIFRYKFTGQILDEDTGLYYYKSRYYDPFLARFIQADDRANQGINGLNRYMYVGGNPTNSIDPNGHVNLSQAIHMFNRIVGHILGKNFHNGNSPSFQSIGHDLSRGMLFKGAVRIVGYTLAAIVNSIALTFEFYVGLSYNLLNGYGLPKLSFRHGALLIENSGIGNILKDEGWGGGGITLAPVIYMGRHGNGILAKYAYRNSLQHEYGHISEFYDWGGIDYYSSALSRPFQGSSGGGYLETNADVRAGTNDYLHNYSDAYLNYLIFRNVFFSQVPSNPRNEYIIFNIFLSLGIVIIPFPRSY